MDSELNVLDVPMKLNDAGAQTVRDYLKELLWKLWGEGESFSGKRPFGNSGWEYDLYRALVEAEVASGKLDEFGDLVDFDKVQCDDLIFDAIDALA